MLVTSDPLRTKDAAMKSMSLIKPHLVKSSSSFLVKVGRSTMTPGKLTFLRSLHATKICETLARRSLFEFRMAFAQLTQLTAEMDKVQWS